MATQNKFNVFVSDLEAGAHRFATDTYKVMLTNTAPVATNTVKANITEITAGNGYTAGGTATTISQGAASGTNTVSGTQVVFTATGAVGPFRYAVLYNDTQTTPAKPLVSWVDNGSAVTMAATDTFTVKFNGASPGTIHTLV